jgi:hypothetical protein
MRNAKSKSGASKSASSEFYIIKTFFYFGSEHNFYSVCKDWFWTFICEILSTLILWLTFEYVRKWLCAMDEQNVQIRIVLGPYFIYVLSTMLINRLICRKPVNRLQISLPGNRYLKKNTFQIFFSFSLSNRRLIKANHTATQYFSRLSWSLSPPIPLYFSNYHPNGIQM